MKQILIICTLAVAVSSLALGQTRDKQAEKKQAVPNSQAEQEIMKLENELVEARLLGDAATADLLMAGDYFFMARDGVVHGNLKAALLVRMRSGESGADLLGRIKPDEGDEPMPQPAKIDDTQVHVYGDTGVVIARSTYKNPLPTMPEKGSIFMSVKLFVGNLTQETTSTEIHDLFSAVGVVESCQLIADRETGRPKGFGFVEMDSRAAADAAKEKFNGHNLHGNTLKVNEAKPRIWKQQ